MNAPRKKRAPVRARLAIDYIFDIECANWTEFLVGIVLVVATGEALPFRDPEAMARFVVTHRGTYWSHNGGRYDELWLLDWLEHWKVSTDVYATGGRITLIELERRHRYRDSMALVPMGLGRAAALAGTRKTSPGFPCVCGKGCGGFCSLHRDMPDEDWLRLIEYCANDCQVTASVLVALQEFADEHDLDLRGTLASSAYATARRRRAIPDAMWDAEDYKACALASHGGRSEVYMPQSAGGFHDDIHAAYPGAIAETPLPTGVLRKVDGREAGAALERDEPGIYEAKVTVRADTYVPPLPYRGPGGRLAFPTGTFRGSWVGLELRHALLHGARVEMFGTARLWPETTTALRDEVLDLWRLRESLGTKPMAGWVKDFTNSFTGKLAQRPDTELVLLNPKRIILCDPRLDCDGQRCGDPRLGCCVHAHAHGCRGMERIGAPVASYGPGGKRVREIWVRYGWAVPRCGHIHWAATLTAANRVKLHTRMVAAGVRLAYVDTDATFAEKDLGGRGDGLGQWRHVGRYRFLECLAPKTYRYQCDGALGCDADPRHELPSWHVLAKGIPNADWEALCGGEDIVVSRGVRSFHAGLSRDKFFEPHTETRRSWHDGVHYGSRIRDGEVTRPMSIEELEATWAR